MYLPLLISQIGKVFASIGVVLVCIALFIGSFLLNKKTKKPDGYENLDETCSGCQLTQCSHHPNQKQEENKGDKNND